MKRRHLGIIGCSILMLLLTACEPKVVETVKDPFVLGVNQITEIKINLRYNIIVKDTDPITNEILETAQWVKTTATIKDTETLKHTLVDNKGYLYSIYRQDDKFLAIITHPDYSTIHRYWISDDAMTNIISYLMENYLHNVPGVFDFVSAYIGLDDSEAFTIKPQFLTPYYRTNLYSKLETPADVSRSDCAISLVDELGNLYHFYEVPRLVVVISAIDQSSTQYGVDFSSDELRDLLINAYPGNVHFNELLPVTFMEIYLGDLATFSPSKMLPLPWTIGQNILNRLKLDHTYKASRIPDAQSGFYAVLKSDKGLYYVLYYDPYVIGVGPDPKGPLTYYSLTDHMNSDIGGFLVDFPLPAPSGTSVSNAVFTRTNAIMYCECDVGVDLSLSQSNALHDLMDLGIHASVRLDRNPYYDNDPLTDLFGLTDSKGRQWRFIMDETNNEIFFVIDYNGQDAYGQTYYWIDDAGYQKILEAHYKIAGMIFTEKADANPTFDAFYVGDQLATATALKDLAMTTLTTDQITKIDGYLQRPQWQELSMYYATIRLNSSFILRKNSSTFYIFSKVGSMTVVTESVIDGQSKVYLVPSGALSNTLTYLKTLK